MDFENAKSAFISLLDSIVSVEKSKFLSWVQKECGSDISTSKDYINLKIIAQDIKSLVPLNAIFSSEKVASFLPGTDSETTPTLHVDSFLYEDDDIDSEVEERNLCRNYCMDCHSVNIAPITYISHSVSIERILILFKYILPDLRGKVFLDVGSRLGAVLYGAYHCSEAKKVIGVELNEDLCKLQIQMINKYKMQKRVQVIHDDICNQTNVIKAANVIFLNNVFECFMSEEDQIKIWLWLRKTVLPGTLLVTVPSMEETLVKLKTNINISEWLKAQPVIDPVIQMKMENQDLVSEVCSYTVLKNIAS